MAKINWNNPNAKQGLCPFGIKPSEQIYNQPGFTTVREAVWRGYVDLDEAKRDFPNEDWAEVERFL